MFSLRKGGLCYNLVLILKRSAIFWLSGECPRPDFNPWLNMQLTILNFPDSQVVAEFARKIIIPNPSCWLHPSSSHFFVFGVPWDGWLLIANRCLGWQPMWSVLHLGLESNFSTFYGKLGKWKTQFSSKKHECHDIFTFSNCFWKFLEKTEKLTTSGDLRRPPGSENSRK